MPKFLPSLLSTGFSGVAVLLVFAVLLAIPADETRADSGHPGGSYPLHRAAGYNSDLVAVIHLLGGAHGIDVNAKAANGDTPLHSAVRHGRATIAATLIEAGAEVNAKDDDGWTPLHQAAYRGYVPVVSVLLAAGADVNVKTNRGDTPLHRAAHNGHAAIVAALIAAGADLGAKDNSGWTPLHRAASHGHAAIAAALIAAGAEVNAKSDLGETPLHRAVRNGRAAVVATLIATLIATGATAEADWEQRHTGGRALLHMMAGTNNWMLVRKLVRVGANVDALDEKFSTPLHHAARGNAAKSIAELVKGGANLESKDEVVYVDGVPFGGMTPLHYAAENSSPDALVALLDGGANLEAQDALGFTPLHIAAKKGKREIAGELVKRGANINAVNQMGMTPMDHAVKEKHFALVDELQKAAQKTREIPQEKPKKIFPTAKTEAGDVFELTWRSVVVIETGGGQGSGVALKPNLVATNCHVTDAATSPIAVFKGENRRADKSQSHPARVVAGDRQRDVCLLEVPGLWAIPAETRKAAEMKIAEQVYAVGAPKGLDFSISGGLVSQLRGEDAEGNALVGAAPLIQTDTAISPGSSGGGLFDAQGRLVGLTTFAYRDSEGLNFAVPIEWAMELIPAAE